MRGSLLGHGYMVVADGGMRKLPVGGCARKNYVKTLEECPTDQAADSEVVESRLANPVMELWLASM